MYDLRDLELMPMKYEIPHRQIRHTRNINTQIKLVEEASILFDTHEANQGSHVSLCVIVDIHKNPHLVVVTILHLHHAKAHTLTHNAQILKTFNDDIC